MTLLQSWLQLLTRRQLGRRLYRLWTAAQAESKHVKAGSKQTEEADAPDRSDSRNLFFTGNAVRQRKSPSKGQGDKYAFFAARVKARDEHHALLDSIHAQLRPQDDKIEAIMANEGDAADLLAMQNMFWIHDPFARPHREKAIGLAVRSIAQYNRIAADESTLCLYCDGAKFDWGAGCAVVAPKLRYSLLKRVTHVDAPLPSYDTMYQELVTSAGTELFGMVLSLETAARFAARGQKVAIFCDAQGTVDLRRKIWADSHGLGPEPLNRALSAIKRLKQRDITVRTYWLAKNFVIPGAHLAHVSARKAAHFEPGEEIELSERAWQRQILVDAAEDARHSTHGRE